MRRIATLAIALAPVLYTTAIFVPFEPEERRPGTRLGGNLAQPQEVDWQGRKRILVETRTWYQVRHSVTTTSWVQDGTIYVPCGQCSIKRWPKNVASDPRVRLKIDGSLYNREAVLITDPEERRVLLGTPMSEPMPEDLAVYRMESPGG